MTELPRTTAPADELTPLMKQYWDLKAQAGDALMLFRMGDFYELFDKDAVTASRILEITLTTRDKGKANPMPMAGVPHHSAQSYIQKLLRSGYKVAIAEQMEDPALLKSGSKAIVRRDIIRTFTPAVQFSSEGAEANYLATALPIQDSLKWILACLDASTGEILTSAPLTPESLSNEISVFPIRHFLRIGHDLPEHTIATLGFSDHTLLEDLPTNYLSQQQADELLKRHYGLEDLSAFLAHPTAIHATAILVSYTLRSQKQERLNHLRLPLPMRKPRTMILGPRTAQHLDIIPSTEGSPCLFHLINRTRSALGSRQIKRWLLEPLKNTAEIRARQESVQELTKSPQRLQKLSERFSNLYDLERIIGRVTAGLANPRDTLALGNSLSLLSSWVESLSGFSSPTLTSLKTFLTEKATALMPLGERIIKTQRDAAPLISREGGIFTRGTTPELDHLLTLTEDGQRWLIQLETRERELTGIPSLKVRYNRVFGYYIEITQAHLKNAPSHYQRKQTTVGAERFFTEELKRFEEEIITASTRQKALEQQLFDELIQAIRTETASIMETAHHLGELDALAALAHLGTEAGWSFPEIDDSLDLEIESGRHPLVDPTMGGKFVPNDTELSPNTRLTLLITGPNMGGKSTVMRQVALIVILGQIGAPVPAKKARWGAFSAIYTRIGAHDAIARGQSTFMVEMSELAHILHHAEERSLILLDEIGRGTSTYDGMSVAWATLEWICTKIKARTLFATHYHELTRLAGVLPLLANVHMAVEGTRSLQRGSLRFLYKLREGPTNESFGIHVAQIAGLPAPVIERSWRVLEDLESGPEPTSDQLSLFCQAMPTPCIPNVLTEPKQNLHPVVQKLEEADLNEMTPIQALNFLVKLQGTARESSSESHF